MKLRLIGDKGESMADTLFDSGASRSLIRSDLAEKVCTIRELRIPRKLTLANGRSVENKYMCEVGIELGGKLIGLEAFLVDGLPVPLLIGVLDMEAYRIKLNVVKGELDLSEFTGELLALSS